MPDLAAFQQSFSEALLSDGELPPSLRSPALTVYRNTCAQGAIEALRDTYSTVNTLLGDEMFTAIALDYRREKPPAGPILSDYGAGFADFMTYQQWFSEVPYIADVARLDWLWIESFLAAGAEALPASPAGSPQINLHPATRFVWLATPALTIWQAHRDLENVGELEPDWREEGALFTRPDFAVQIEPIDPVCYQLLLAFTASTGIDERVEQVAGTFPEADIPQLLQRCVTSGALIIH